MRTSCWILKALISCLGSMHSPAHQLRACSTQREALAALSDWQAGFLVIYHMTLFFQYNGSLGAWKRWPDIQEQFHGPIQSSLLGLDKWPIWFRVLKTELMEQSPGELPSPAWILRVAALGHAEPWQSQPATLSADPSRCCFRLFLHQMISHFSCSLPHLFSLSEPELAHLASKLQRCSFVSPLPPHELLGMAIR